LRGICIFSGSLKRDEVQAILADDPTVETGRLVPKISEFFGIPGDSLK